MYKSIQFIFLIYLGLVGAQPEGKIVWQSSEGITLKAFTGPEAFYYWQELVPLVVEVYKEYPYLYDCKMEADWMLYFKQRTFLHSSLSNVLIIFDNEKVIGFSYSIPLNEEVEIIQHDFLKNNAITRNYLYIGDTLISPYYQGKGLIKKIIASHEEHAQKIVCSSLVLVAIDRPENYCSKPSDYRSLDSLWDYLGFQKNGMKVYESWLQVDTKKVEDNVQSIWIKKLT
jgi:hypothetical protein